MPEWVDISVKLTPAFITLVVGLIASFVAYLQYKINKDRLKLDLFEKRLAAFEKLQEYFIRLMRDGCVKDDALNILAEARYKSRFLFGPEIDSYLDEVWDKGADMLMLRTRLYGAGSLPVGDERSSVCDAESKLLRWNMDELKSPQKRFAPYMRFPK